MYGGLGFRVPGLGFLASGIALSKKSSMTWLLVRGLGLGLRVVSPVGHPMYTLASTTYEKDPLIFGVYNLTRSSTSKP